MKSCPQCGSNKVSSPHGMPSVFDCYHCGHCWEWKAESLPRKTETAVNLSRERLANGSLGFPKPIGPSPYPCPACGSVINITVCYRGRSEDWTCGHCHHTWIMNATPEQPIT